MRLDDAYQKIVLVKLTGFQKYRVNLILFFFLVFPFLNIFSHLDRPFSTFEPYALVPVFNYTAVLGFGIAFLFQKNKFSPQILVTVAILLAVLVMNYLLTPLASLKWLLNWVAFIFVSTMIVQIVSSFNSTEMKLLQTNLLILLNLLLITLALLVAFTWLTNISDFLSSGMSNSTIAILTNKIGVEKQAFGIFLALLVILIFTCGAALSKSMRIIFVISFLIIFPAAAAIRTLWLSLFLCAAWLYFVKYRSRRSFVYFSILIAPFVFSLFQTVVMGFVTKFYDRWSSLQFAWSIIIANPLGFGNGGYHVFVAENHQMLIGLFGSELMATTGLFWAAPESDLVYFIASWGGLSVIFFTFFGYILLRGGRIFHYTIGLLPIERSMLLMTGIMIFMGISQDNAGELIWWVFMAAGYGVILRYRRFDQKGIQT